MPADLLSRWKSAGISSPVPDVCPSGSLAGCRSCVASRVATGVPLFLETRVAAVGGPDPSAHGTRQRVGAG